jgi:hypothetical protein
VGNELRHATEDTARPMTVVAYYWRGDGPLWKIYWLYGVLLSLGLAVVAAAAGLGHWVPVPGLIAVLIGLATYTAWVLVSVWRCAENVEGRPFGYDPELWTALARTATIAWAVNEVALSILLIQMSVDSW